MRFTRSQKTGLLVAAALIILSLVLPYMSAAAETKVIGKLHLKTGAEVLVMIVSVDGALMPFSGKAFEDQTLYILERIENDKGKGYKADGAGFAHDCPTHGREVFEADIFILVVDQQIDGDMIKVEIFPIEKE